MTLHGVHTGFLWSHRGSFLSRNGSQEGFVRGISPGGWPFGCPCVSVLYAVGNAQHTLNKAIPRRCLVAAQQVHAQKCMRPVWEGVRKDGATLVAPAEEKWGCHLIHGRKSHPGLPGEWWPQS